MLVAAKKLQQTNETIEKTAEKTTENTASMKKIKYVWVIASTTFLVIISFVLTL